MEDPKNDFFEHIKQTLRNHEEQYRKGAWEAFAKQQAVLPGKKAPVLAFLKWAVAAAAIIAGVLLALPYFFTPNKTAQEPSIVKTIDPKNNTPSTLSDTDHTLLPHEEAPPIAQGTMPPATLPDAPAYNNTPLTPVFPEINSGQSNIATCPGVVLSGVRPLELTPPQQPVPGQKQATTAPLQGNFWQNRIVTDQQQLTHEPVSTNKAAAPALAYNHPQQEPEEKKRKTTGKWTPSLFLSPLFTDGDVQMGYGVSLGYAINDKISISAGVAHNKLAASREYDLSGAGNPAADAPGFGLSNAKNLISAADASGPRLENVAGVVSGFDIPVDVSYNISKKLYATAGVSGLVIVNDNTKYTYVTNNNVRISVENNKGILQEDKTILVQQYSTSNVAPEAASKEKTPFLGFYNVSMGFKQKVSPKNNVAIEPFLKVPMKNVSDQKLNYTGMGVRLKFDF